MEAIKVQADLGVQTIRVQGESDLARINARVFGQAVELTGFADSPHESSERVC